MALALAVPTPAVAGADAKQPRIPVAVEVQRHFTTNALGEPLAISDWYTLMRGSIDRTFTRKDGYTKLAAALEVTRYDTVPIEDDRAMALSAEFSQKFNPAVELRGTLSFSVLDVGDDLLFGDFVLGTRQLKFLGGAGAQLGVDLGGGRTLVFGLGAATERPGLTHFEDDVADPLQLDPDQRQFEASVKFVQAVGVLRYGGLAAARWLDVDPLGDPPVALGSRVMLVQAEAGAKASSGAEVRVALGAQLLQGEQDIFRQARPSYEAMFAVPYKRFQLRGLAFARFETQDTDDPLASWLRRYELEAGYSIGKPLVVGLGGFSENKQNLLFENEERSRGWYAQLRYEAPSNFSVTLRLDWSKTVKTVIDERIDTVDTFLAVRKSF